MPANLSLMSWIRIGPICLAITWSPCAFGWTPSRSICEVKPAWVEQSAMKIGDCVEFCAVTQPGIASLTALMGALFDGRGMTLSICRRRAGQLHPHFPLSPGTRGFLTMIFMRGLDARISPAILV